MAGAIRIEAELHVRPRAEIQRDVLFSKVGDELRALDGANAVDLALMHLEGNGLDIIRDGGPMMPGGLQHF